MKQRPVVITGSNSGISRETACRFAEAGADEAVSRPGRMARQCASC